MSPGLLLLAAFVVGLVVAALVPPGRQPDMGRGPGATHPREVTDDGPGLPRTSSDLAVRRDERGSV